MWCVIDVQGYATSEHVILPKEVVICSETSLEKFVIKPPKPLWEYEQKDKDRINWAQNKYHHIPFNYGDTEHDELNQLIYFSVAKYEKIFTKGREKATYLTNLLGREVIDLSNTQCPSIRKDVGPACAIHTKQPAHCAEANAKFLKLWIATHLEKC
jgi:hypothetical protein